MQNILHPSIGSNQHITKFDKDDEDKKEKKVDYKKIAVKVLFSWTTWKIMFVIVSLASMYSTYYFAKQTYNVRCGINGEVVGYFTKKSTCDELNEDKKAFLERDRVERMLNNPDLF